MSGLESRVQGIVHTLEQGTAALLIKIAVSAVAIVGLVLVYLIPEFRGLKEAAGMEQAQIAREVSRGNGFSTKAIRPLAMWQLQKNGRDLPGANFPDTYHMPLWPMLNSVPFRIFQSKMGMTPNDIVYFGDRLVAIAGVACLLGSLVFYYLAARRLFDGKLALLGCALALTNDLTWQYAISGLAHPLLFLFFGALCYCMVRAIDNMGHSTPTGFWLALSGALFGLMAMTHGMAVFLFAGALLFVGIYFRPRLLSLLLFSGFFFVVCLPWLIRNYSVCGSPFGVGIYGMLDGINGTEDQWMRSLSPAFQDIRIGTVRNKLEMGVTGQIGSLVESLGYSVVAPAFFLGLLHVFKRPSTGHFRWFLLACWVGAATGMSIFGMRLANLSPNQLHIVFLPMMGFFGLAFLLVLWRRLPIDFPFLRISFIVLLFLLSGLPMIFQLVPKQEVRVQWPPYVPPYISILNKWTEPRELIASDMPWAVAWYADRKSLWLPQTPAEMVDISDFSRLGGPVVGMYLTPVSGHKPLWSSIVKGEYKEWASFIIRSPNLPGFPLTAATALPIDNECVFYADRDRWSAEGAMPTQMPGEKKKEQ